MSEFFDSVLRHFWRDESPHMRVMAALLRRAVQSAIFSDVELRTCAEGRPPLRIRRFFGLAA